MNLARPINRRPYRCVSYFVEDMAKHLSVVWDLGLSTFTETFQQYDEELGKKKAQEMSLPITGGQDLPLSYKKRRGLGKTDIFHAKYTAYLI